MLQNEGQIAFVTGAGGGIGRAIAMKFASLGASVVVADLNLEGAEQTVAMLPDPTGKARHAALRMDVTNRENVQEGMRWVGETYGRIDLLMNNAGVSTMHHLVDLTEQEWDFNFNVNVKGMFLVTQAAASLMIPNGSGRIVNTCSMAAVKPDPTLPHYTASKFAVLGLTKACALEFAQYNITVNCVCPGVILTDMTRVVGDETLRELAGQTPLGRNGTPQDVANAMLYLAQADFVTGQLLPVNGGFVL